jgi:hypothetical protein
MSSQRTQLPPILRAEPINGLALTLIALLALIRPKPRRKSGVGKRFELALSL